MKNIWILAQTGGQTPSGVTEQPLSAEQTEAVTTVPSGPNALSRPVRKPPGLFGSPLFMIGLLFILMYFMLFRGPRKKQQKHKQMVKSLQKNDRIRTIGGIIGTVVDIKDDEITLKIDEANNTKIKIATSAIGRNMSQDKD